jgi:hypothetical protein
MEEARGCDACLILFLELFRFYAQRVTANEREPNLQLKLHFRLRSEAKRRDVAHLVRVPSHREIHFAGGNIRVLQWKYLLFWH